MAAFACLAFSELERSPAQAYFADTIQDREASLLPILEPRPQHVTVSRKPGRSGSILTKTSTWHGGGERSVTTNLFKADFFLETLASGEEEGAGLGKQQGKSC